MSLDLKRYLKLLRKEAGRLERTDINNNVDESCSARYLVKTICASISIFLLFTIRNGFSEVFISFVSDTLSIIVGLFITALIFSFDKFYEPTNTENPNSRIKLWDTQAYNYAKKFAYITSYTIVLSIFTLSLLAISALFESGSKLNVFNLNFCFDCISISKPAALVLFIKSTFVIFQRFFIIYWLLKIVYNTLFIVSSMVQYMTTKIDRK